MLKKQKRTLKDGTFRKSRIDTKYKQRRKKAEMYYIVGKQHNFVAPDLLEYIKGRDYVSVALRTARDLNAGEKESQQFIDELKRRGNSL